MQFLCFWANWPYLQNHMGLTVKPVRPFDGTTVTGSNIDMWPKPVCSKWNSRIFSEDWGRDDLIPDDEEGSM